MKNNTSKIHKFFETLIYTILISLPLISVFVRSIYVQSNDNAKDSYYGETINQSTQVSTTIDEMEQGSTYYIKVETIDTENTLSNITLRVTNIVDLGSGTSYSSDIYNRVRFFKGTNTQIYTQIMRIDGGSSVTFTSNRIIQFDFVAIDNTGSIVSYLSSYYFSYNKYSYLDNAFEYSMYNIVSTYGKGNINFVNWLGNLFFNNTNDLLYFNFVNLYLNYALVVSVAYLIWFILDWFIKFVKGLLNSFLPKGD